MCSIYLIACVITSTTPLTLQDVERSALRSAPKLRIAEHKVRQARGEALSAQGAFDLYAKGEIGRNAAGFYDESTQKLSLLQSTPWWGSSFFASYRRGEDFPIYGAKAVTYDAGEVSAGWVLPLWRGGPTDERRFARTSAELGVHIANQLFRREQLAIRLNASIVYWKWLAAKEKLRIGREMLTLAERRTAGIEQQVQRGHMPRIERLDNERLIISRREQVIIEERNVQAQTIKLSLYFRDLQGRPVLVDPARAPDGFPDPVLPNDDDATRAFERATSRRPELSVLQAEIKRERAKLALVRNDRAPQIDLSLAVSQDLGNKTSYGPDPAFVSKGETEVNLNLVFAWPVQQRKARGKEQSAMAKLDVLTTEEMLLLDTIRAEIQDVWSELQTAQARSVLAVRAYVLTKQVEEGERQKLELGESNILTVNLREEATAKAQKEIVAALLAFHQAWAIFRAITGDFPKGPETPAS